MTIEENRILILYVSFGFQPDSIIEQVEIQASIPFNVKLSGIFSGDGYFTCYIIV